MVTERNLNQFKTDVTAQEQNRNSMMDSQKTPISANLAQVRVPSSYQRKVIRDQMVKDIEQRNVASSLERVGDTVDNHPALKSKE